jgi:hypothetical protein
MGRFERLARQPFGRRGWQSFARTQQDSWRTGPRADGPIYLPPSAHLAFEVPTRVIGIEKEPRRCGTDRHNLSCDLRTAASQPAVDRGSSRSLSDVVSSWNFLGHTPARLPSASCVLLVKLSNDALAIGSKPTQNLIQLGFLALVTLPRLRRAEIKEERQPADLPEEL